MDFNDTPEEGAFRKEVRAWLEANATRRSNREEKFGADLNHQDYLALAKAWRKDHGDCPYASNWHNYRRR